MVGMKRLYVGMPNDKGYEVRIGPGALDLFAKYLSEQGFSKQLVVVSDATVAALYGEAMRDMLEEGGFAVADLVVPAGEQSKTPECAARLCSQMAEIGVDRNATVLALGGGVVGDLAGFAASVYLRGVHYVQVPTTLLAMVDSSVGGKTAVDLPEGKNLMGTFKQPSYVLADINTLETLPDKEWLNGYAEAAKSAMLHGGDFYSWLVANAQLVRAKDPQAVRDLVVNSVTFKAGVVAQDETERAGVRECLNYGHTLAHAIEVEAGYGTFGHGVAVAEGIRFAARLAADVLGTSQELVREQEALLDALGVASIGWAASPQVMLGHMKKDKKTRGGDVRFVLLDAVGSWQVATVPDDKILSHLEAWRASKEGMR